MAKLYDKKVKALYVHQRLSSSTIGVKRELNCIMDLKVSIITMLDGRIAIFVHFMLSDNAHIGTTEGRLAQIVG